ncbi:MAG: DUF2905 domain-containing protein [Acidimicrobiia bacterium]
MERELGRFLILLGGVLVLVGIVIVIGGRLGLGRLPGDIVISRGNFRFYAPLGTCLLLSIVLTALLRFFSYR